MEIDLSNPDNFLRSEKDGARFVPLGRKRASKITQSDINFILQRTRSPGNNIWATLGPWDERESPFTGRILCSRAGERYSTANYAGEATVQEVTNVREAREDFLNRDPDSNVIERYISLEDVTPKKRPKTFTLEDLSHARLTVFVRPDEGALVFYQRMERYGGQRRIKDPRHTDVEYLVPEATDIHNECGQRDRLHYRLPLYPEVSFDLQSSGADAKLKADAEPDYKIVIKVLVFRRQNSTSRQVIQRAARRLGLSRHNLLKYRPESAVFEEVEGDGITGEDRTLLLLHGTFSSTEGTYGNLLERRREDKEVFLTQLIRQGYFDQILAFDHDTIFVPPAENVRRFDETLADHPLVLPVRAMGFSRGALVLKQIAISGQAAQIEHGVTIAGANHVGYFSALRGFNWFLTALRYMNPAGAGLKVLSAIAQHSGSAIDCLEGLRAMDQRSSINQGILGHSRLPTTLIPITGNFDISLVKGPFRRMTRRTLNAAISLLLTTREHDWVVACEEQGRIEPLTPVEGFDPIGIDSRHTHMIGNKLSDEDLRRALLWRQD